MTIKVEVEVEKITGWMELLAAGIELGLWPSKCNTLTLMPVTFGFKFGQSGGSFPGAGATQPIKYRPTQ